MIFIGDIALPFSNSINITKIPNELLGKRWIGNLEGGIIDNSKGKFKKSRAVFNDKKAIEELVNQFNFTGFVLANNHILDLTSINSNLIFLENLNMPYTGVGENLIDASKPLILEDEKVIILNFGWEVIQCETASKNTPGVNPLQKEHVLTVLSNTIAKHPNAYVVPYMHWSYELESEPQPFERELAKTMIDKGAAGVIGSHPHRIGGFERYKDKPIVYSLGNWMFMQNYYCDGKLSFPDFCNLELAFEWDFKVNTFMFHFFEYDRDKFTLTYLRTEDENSPTMLKHTPFFNLSSKDYKSWYKMNHYHKNKGLPIYYWEDSPFQIQSKNKWVSMRAKLMKVILNKGK
jgi:poly-gamma-glutamate synthesis protein (capsule biosynthesis protein)